MSCLSVWSKIKNVVVSVAAIAGFSLRVAAEPVQPSISVTSDVKNDIHVKAEYKHSLIVYKDIESGKLTCTASIVCAVGGNEIYLDVAEGHLMVAEGFIIMAG